MELACKRCGAEDVPARGPGKGPHAAAALCAHCGAFIKWVPKERTTMGIVGMNRVALIGLLTKYGVEVQFLNNGHPKATFSLNVQEVGQDGKVYENFFPCEVYGKKAEAAGAVEAGTLCLLEGKLRKRPTQQDGKWEVIVSGYELIPMLPAKEGQPA